MAGFRVSKARLNVFLLLTNPSSSKAIEILMPLGVWAVYSVISGFLSAIEPSWLFLMLFGFVLGWVARSEDLGDWLPRWLQPHTSSFIRRISLLQPADAAGFSVLLSTTA